MTRDTTPLRTLPAINPATGQPWVCVTPAEHNCDGDAIGAIGAYPVCRHGMAAERDRREVEQARQDALLADPDFRAQIEREARQEQALERRFA